MARCAADACRRWCPDLFARHGAGAASTAAGSVRRVASKGWRGAGCSPPGRRHSVFGLSRRPDWACCSGTPPQSASQDVDRALAAQRQSGLKLGAQLQAMGAADGHAVLRALAAQAGLSYIAALDPLCVHDAPGGLSPDAVQPSASCRSTLRNTGAFESRSPRLCRARPSARCVS